jgi:hypothetical protein
MEKQYFHHKKADYSFLNPSSAFFTFRDDVKQPVFDVVFAR